MPQPPSGTACDPALLTPATGICAAAWLTNPNDPPVCGQKPIRNTEWNQHPGCVPLFGAVRDPYSPTHWAFTPTRWVAPSGGSTSPAG